MSKVVLSRMYSVLIGLLALVSLVSSQQAKCPTGYSPIAGFDDCFKLYEWSKVFREAETICTEDGGHLASIHSAQEVNNLKIFLNGATPLIGVQCPSSSSCMWSDFTPYDFEDFAGGKPNTDYGNCGYFYGSNIYSWNCGVPMNSFLCRYASTNMTTPLAPLACPYMQLFQNNGTVYSPGYPLSVPAQTECQYILSGNIDSFISVTFPTFDIDSNANNTKLSLYDGTAATKPMVVLSGSEAQGRTFSSTGNSLVMAFETSATTSGDGWMATFHSVPKSSECALSMQSVLIINTDISSVTNSAAYRQKIQDVVSKLAKHYTTAKAIDNDSVTCEYNRNQETNVTLMTGSLYADAAGIGIPNQCISNMDGFTQSIAKAEYAQGPAVTLASVISYYSKWYNTAKPQMMDCHCFDYANTDTTNIMLWTPLSPTSKDNIADVSFAGFDGVGFQHIVMPFGFGYDESPLWAKLVPDRRNWLRNGDNSAYSPDQMVDDIIAITCRMAGRTA